jgi:hypothetical protein
VQEEEGHAQGGDTGKKGSAREARVGIVGSRDAHGEEGAGHV